MRVELAERVLVSWLVVDASASMAFGTAERRKADVAEGVAIAVGYAATRRGNRLGLVSFGAESRCDPPRQGRVALIETLRLLREVPPAGTGSLADALELTDRVSRQRSLIVIVSDFRGPLDWRPALLRLAGRHTVLAVEVRDPREQELADVGRACGSSIPRAAGSCASTRAARSSASGSPQPRSDERRQLVTMLSSVGVRHVALSTEGDWLRPLAAFLRRSEAPPLSFEAPVLLVFLLAVPAAVGGLRVARAAPRRARRCLDDARAGAEPGAARPGLAPAHSGRAAAGGRHAAPGRLRAPEGDDHREAPRGDRRARPRRLGLDGGERRRSRAGSPRRARPPSVSSRPCRRPTGSP